MLQLFHTRILRNANRLAAIAGIALATLAALAATSHAATGAGSLDPTFGTGGKRLVDLQAGSGEDIGFGVVQPDGKLVSSGYLPKPGGDDGTIPVVRFLDNGAPDPSFGTGGVAVLAIDDSAYADSYGPALGADGRIFVVGGASSNGLYRCIVAALRPDGSYDPGFAEGGIFRYPAAGTKGNSCINIAVQSDGKLLVLGNEDGFKANYVLRLTPAGALDPTFGVGGVAAVPGTTLNFVYGLSIAPNGAFYLSGGPASNGEPARIYRYTSAGVLDAAFGNGGAYVLPQTNTFLHSIKALADGSAIASGYHGSKHFVLKIDATGTPVAGFGANGVTEFTLGGGYSAVALEIQRDGKILVGVRHRELSGTWRFAVVRLTAAGLFDATYGNGGIVLLDFGTTGEVLYGIAQAPDGKVWVFGRADLSGNEQSVALARLLPDEITTQVIEFFNSDLHHYFITADPNEAAAIDGGSAGPGWSRTNQTFKSGGPNKAGRFYGNPDINPANGLRRGPNGHFYSLDLDEIAQVRKDIGWRFESYDFNAWPKVNGSCPAGTIAVLRVYNNRFAQNDSNHRYTVVQAIYDQMVAEGWSGEGKRVLRAGVTPRRNRAR
jgi:uncharacterized delta-60 repeat protein